MIIGDSPWPFPPPVLTTTYYNGAVGSVVFGCTSWSNGVDCYCDAARLPSVYL